MKKLCSLLLLMCTAFAQPTEYQVERVVAGAEKLFQEEHDAWTKAQQIEWGPEPYVTEFRSLWTPEGLYLRFDSQDDNPWHGMKSRDQHLWEEEVVEIFLDLNRSGRNYAELEINPANVICDLHMLQPALDQKGDLTWNFEGIKSRVFPLRDGNGKTRGWTAVAFLPWTDFKSLPSAAGISLPPKVGERWQFNVFRIKRPGGKENPQKDAVFAAWSKPDGPSFHTPSAFRDFVFK